MVYHGGGSVMYHRGEGFDLLQRGLHFLGGGIFSVVY